jgi:pimeloyl-ACP methyl ester carboxylesterase
MNLPSPYDVRLRRDREELERLLNPVDPDDLTPVPQPTKAIVCIHGILSGHDTCFNDFFRVISQDQRFQNWELCWYDYDYNGPMEENGRKLARTLTSQFSADDHVVLVCHSMGGLVARFAVLTTHLKCIKRVVMIGTPNFGAFRSHQLCALLQLALLSTHKIYGVFSRKQGILDLTRVPELFKRIIDASDDVCKLADHVEYITIPGMYFDVDKNLWRTELERWKLIFSGVDLGLAILSGLPVLHAKLKRPHDGIVEADSNCMIPIGAEVPDTEKTAPITDERRYPNPTYAHVVHRKACKELTHVAIQHDERIIRLVADLLDAQSVEQWDRDRSGDHILDVRFRR